MLQVLVNYCPQQPYLSTVLTPERTEIRQNSVCLQFSKKKLTVWPWNFTGISAVLWDACKSWLPESYFRTVFDLEIGKNAGFIESIPSLTPCLSLAETLTRWVHALDREPAHHFHYFSRITHSDRTLFSFVWCGTGWLYQYRLRLHHWHRGNMLR